MDPLKFNFLHFSDLHWDSSIMSYSLNKDHWGFFTDKLIADIKQIKNAAGIEKWHALFFSGDVVKSGKDYVGNGLDQVLEKLSIDDPELKFFCVPGNHDFNRDKNQTDKCSAECKETQCDPVLLYKNDAYEKHAADGFTNYYNWFNPHWENKLQGTSKSKQLSSGDMCCSFEIGNISGKKSIGIVGLNSAFTHTCKKENKGKHCLINNCKEKLFNNNVFFNWSKEQDLIVLLTHHPSDWMDVTFSEDYWKRVAHIHLFGHLHESTEKQEIINGNCGPCLLQGASMFSFLKYGNNEKVRQYGYSVGSIIFQGKNPTLHFYPRSAIMNGKETIRFEKNSFYNYVKPDEFIPIKLSTDSKNEPEKPCDEHINTCKNISKFSENVGAIMKTINEKHTEIQKGLSVLENDCRLIKQYDNYMKAGIISISKNDYNRSNEENTNIIKLHEDFFSSINNNTKQLWLMGTSLRKIFVNETKDACTDNNFIKRVVDALFEGMKMKVIINSPFGKLEGNAGSAIVGKDDIMNIEAKENHKFDQMHMLFSVHNKNIPKNSFDTLIGIRKIVSFVKTNSDSPSYGRILNNFEVLLTDLPLYMSLNYKHQNDKDDPFHQFMITHYMNFGMNDTSTAIVLKTAEISGLSSNYYEEFKRYWNFKNLWNKLIKSDDFPSETYPDFERELLRSFYLLDLDYNINEKDEFRLVTINKIKSDKEQNEAVIKKYFNNTIN